MLAEKAPGTQRIIERCWPFMVRFLEWRKATSKDFLGINHGNDWGDWLSFGGKTPLGRPGQPAELASIYVQLAAADASYANGQVYGSSGGSGLP